MATENTDLFVLQKSGSVDLRKASVSALLADVVTPVLPEVPEKLGDLDDVDDATPNDGDVLYWNGTNWQPGAIDGGTYQLTRYNKVSRFLSVVQLFSEYLEMKIQLKRSNVLDGSSAKAPTAGQMEYGELAVNYNTADPTLFIKDSNDNIIPIAGSSYITEIIEENQQIIVSPNEPTSPTPINGDLWLDTTECPPELKVYTDCSGSAEWETIGGGTAKPIDPTPRS